MTKRALTLVLALALALSLVPSALASNQTVIHASNTQELAAAVENLQSNTRIELDDGDYYCGVSGFDLRNVTIQGTGNTRIITDDGDDVVMFFSGCENIILSGLTIGHELPQGYGCVCGVIYFDGANLTITNCDIFGCGINGITAYGENISVTDSTIRDCSEYILEIGGYDGNPSAHFQRCVFSGNAYNYAGGVPANYVYTDREFDLSFDSCTFRNNKNEQFCTSSEEIDGKLNLTVTNCLFENNGWSNPATNGTGAAQGAVAPIVPAQPSAPLTATPTSSTVTVNGTPTAFDAYNIGGANYFKLRDLAFVLNDTEKHFGVGWDGESNTIHLHSARFYTPVGGEMTPGNGLVQTPVPTSSKLVINNVEVTLEAYNIGGNNYFKLRDIGSAFDFGVDWDGAANTVVIDTTKGYTPD